MLTFDCVDVPAQKWQLMSNGELRGVGGNCLDVVNGRTVNGTKVQMYDCVGAAAQQWSLLSNGSLQGVGANCLDVINGGTVNGTRVQMYDCVDVAAQKWRFSTGVPDPVRVIRSGSLVGVGGNCLDVINGGTANGSQVQMYDCVDVAAQQWKLLSNGELQGVGGNCLDVVNGGTGSGTKVQMYDCVTVSALQPSSGR